ncbi:hypothetical protein ACFE04_001536 [Oxalis oulophora]
MAGPQLAVDDRTLSSRAMSARSLSRKMSISSSSRSSSWASASIREVWNTEGDVVGIDTPKIEVRFEDLFVEGYAYAGTRALPTLSNFALTAVEGVLGFLRIFPSKKRNVQILNGLNGIVKPSRFFRQLLAFVGIHQMALSLFRLIAAVARIPVVANMLGTFTLLMPYNITTVGKTLLKMRGMYTEDYWYWISVGALFAFSLLFNIGFVAALTFLNPLGGNKSMVVEEKEKDKQSSNHEKEKIKETEMTSASTPTLIPDADMSMQRTPADMSVGSADQSVKRGMVLPFQPLSLAFDHVNYYVDMPAVRIFLLHKQQDLLNLLGAVYSAIFFLGATNTTSVQAVVAVERTVFYREKAAGMYSPLPYAFAQVAIETIYVSVQTFIYSLLLFFMIGFKFEMDKYWPPLELNCREILQAVYAKGGLDQLKLDGKINEISTKLRMTPNELEAFYIMHLSGVEAHYKTMEKQPTSLVFNIPVDDTSTSLSIDPIFEGLDEITPLPTQFSANSWIFLAVYAKGGLDQLKLDGKINEISTKFRMTPNELEAFYIMHLSGVEAHYKTMEKQPTSLVFNIPVNDTSTSLSIDPIFEGLYEITPLPTQFSANSWIQASTRIKLDRE